MLPLLTLPSYLNPISLCLCVFFCFPFPVDSSQSTHTSISSFGLQSLFFSFKISQSFYFVCNELQLIVTRRQQLCHHPLIRNCTVTKAISDEVVTQKRYCSGQRFRKQKGNHCLFCLFDIFVLHVWFGRTSEDRLSDLSWYCLNDFHDAIQHVICLSASHTLSFNFIWIFFVSNKIKGFLHFNPW